MNRRLWSCLRVAGAQPSERNTKVEGKRQLAETANSFFHGSNHAITDIGRGYTRMLDSGRINLFLTFSVVGYNRQRIHAWLQERVDGVTS